MESIRRVGIALTVMLVLAVAASPTAAQEPVVAVRFDVPPAELADPIEAVLAAKGQRVTVGVKALDFWWVKSLPLKSDSSEIAWSAVEEGTLVGAVKLSAPFADIRGAMLKVGTYTLRYALQPQNNNHSGASRYREFLLVGPAAEDNSAAGLTHDGSINLAKQSADPSHPASWCLDPPVASEAPLTIRRNDAGQKAIIFDVPVSRDGLDVGVLKFGLILVGIIQS